MKTLEYVSVCTMLNGLYICSTSICRFALFFRCVDGGGVVLGESLFTSFQGFTVTLTEIVSVVLYRDLLVFSFK